MANKRQSKLDERFSLHPHKAEDVLRKLLRTEHHEDSTDTEQQSDKEPTPTP